MFKRLREEYISYQEMNKHLEYCKEHRKIVYSAPTNFIGYNAYIEDKQVFFTLTYKRHDKVIKYICRKDGKEDRQCINGMSAYVTLTSNYYKVPDFRGDSQVRKYLGYLEDQNKFAKTARPFLYFNPKYEGIRLKAIGYDINSSYSAAMVKPMPDTTKPYRLYGIIKEGEEIGFTLTGDNLEPRFKGNAFFIFPLIESPFTNFVNIWYNKKAQARDKEEKAYAKEVLNYCVGYMQKTNPFLRATIIYYANKEIIDNKDENTLYCNTDSIVSLTKRDLPLGTGLGQYKIEHEGEFAYKGSSYQWDKDIPSYRGIPHSWFKKGWDILVDTVPDNGNTLRYNNYKLEVIDENKSKI